ncbi:heavy-metal-associated domain-containing protein [Microvirga flavescens]|uniref:heavy-metal-associated domain-containing protein n=1 Tax=Microvirga flavescens TaxID=2249811 RepID=UPI001FE23781|nr:heavy-metal-associated domain-containing protein [Microvirga flavescens]
MLRFSVPKMSCGHCVATITKAVKSLDPQAGVQADLGKQEIAIMTNATAEQIKDALTTAGYESQKLAA